MKFARLIIDETIVPVVIAGGRSYDLRPIMADVDVGSLQGCMNDEKLDYASLECVKNADYTFLPPVAHVGKIICIGLNYRNHAEEAGLEIPKRPVFFLKATSALSGANDPVVLPQGGDKVDWEGEVAVVIGKYGKNIQESDAMDHVFGYTILNDLSERHYQLEMGGQWVQGKSFDSFAPLGPYLVYKRDIADPHALDIKLWVNDELCQSANTSDMIFRIPVLISYLSQLMSLHPGDIISTGTPSGVGYGMSPQVFLKPGDMIRLSIEGLGQQVQEAV